MKLLVLCLCITILTLCACDSRGSAILPVQTPVVSLQPVETVGVPSASPEPKYKGEMVQTDRSYLLKINMMDNKNGWAESDGMVVRTTDGGKTWLKATPKELQLYGISSGLMIQSYFFSGNHAWIARPPMFTNQETEGTVWRTDNGGESWTKAVLPLTEKWEHGATFYMHFPDLMHGYILVALGNIDHPEKTIYATTDGGLSWKRVSDITGQFKSVIKSIYFRNVNEGWISTFVLDNTDYMYKTEDSGKTWEPVHLLIPAKYKNARFANPETPVFFGENKLEGVMTMWLDFNNSSPVLIYATHDGGRSWTCMGEAPILNTYHIQFIDSKHAYALDNAVNNNKLYMTSDGGKSWTLKSKITIQRINVWQFNNLLDGWVSSSDPGNLYASHDGGTTWTAVKQK